MIYLPLYSRYLLRLYLKPFLLTLSLFLGFAFLLSLKEITLFAALDPSYSNLFLFSIYQIPHILPLALPLSSLLATLLLIRRLSSNFELTALRSSGFSLLSLATPLLFFSYGLSVVNFYLISEVSTRCRLYTRQMLYTKSSNDPLLLLERGSGLAIKHHALILDRLDPTTCNLKLGVAHQEGKSFTLLSCPKLKFEDGKLSADDLLMITASKGDSDDQPSFLTQHTSHIESLGEPLGALLKKNRWKEETNAVPLQLLLQKEGACLEIARRISLALFPLSFTWVAFMLFTPSRRRQRYREVAYLIGLVLISLLLYMVGKHNKAFYSYALFAIPHLLLGLVGFYYLIQVERGNVR